MFDFHMHTKVSYDGRGTPEAMVAAAEAMGLKKICFTDHLDHDPLSSDTSLCFTEEAYHGAYDDLTSDRVEILKGMEFGMVANQPELLQTAVKQNAYDFVIGSVHFVHGLDIYFPQYWEGKTTEEAERYYLEEVLACVEKHSDFDVLGHLTYISKCPGNPKQRIVDYSIHRDLVDGILQALIRKDKGLEVNTSGMSVAGVFLPHEPYLRRFRELGGQIVTVGSDAHSPDRVGQYCKEAYQLVGEIFGHVCTFRGREPIFHKF